MKRPNILFMHVDQMHFQAASAYGNPYVNTPAIDRIVNDGCSLMTNYTTMPQCCPARTSWYTGRMSSESGVPVNACEILPDIPDLGQWLRKHADYDCVYAGKWHIPGRDVTKSFRLLQETTGTGEICDGYIARACMGFLENYKDDKPFFLNAGFMNPHDCCFTAGAYGVQGKFRFAKEIEDKLPPLPKNFIAGGRQAEWTELDWRYYIYSYYRLVELVDAEVGRLYDALMSSRFADNTVVIFTADHGDGLGFHGKLSKGFMEEEAWRVPAIVVYHGRIPKGRRETEKLTSGVDIPATICDYAQVPMLPKMTIGKSLRAIVEGQPISEWREYVAGESFLGKGSVAIRDKQYKTIYYCDSSAVKIFDLIADPLEMKDLSSTELGKSLIKRHKGWLHEFVGKLDLCTRIPENKPDPYRIYLNWYRNLKEEE